MGRNACEIKNFVKGDIQIILSINYNEVNVQYNLLGADGNLGLNQECITKL
jgi:hypothetical protein